ncbi:DUF4335 domain-containing protein [Pantanalinema sp. GBBB05]|uniref:DUF4335 domain-containing protein n=1 Tax=Pantanalinema sp. GBBB05 TaxID=2604139 RepID=UPI001E189A21|nr:DUF4335 domain-containing protein [Pantanalinema sp. GBBB05]
MTIQRQYSLPNCTLILEGLGDGTVAIAPTDPRPLMSILINAECYLSGQEKPLSGGREFFEALVKTVNHYAQELLSGLHSAHFAKDETALVQLQHLSHQTHRLSVRSPVATPSSGGTVQAMQQIHLSTVQLFDLVEAIDQFLADTRTLPDLAFNLKPLSKHAVARSVTASKQVVPAAIGLSSLAAAAVALSFLGVPKVKEPTCLRPDDPGCAAFKAANTKPGASPSPDGSPKPTSTQAPTAASPSPAASSDPQLAALAAPLTAAPEISDPAQVDSLRQQLYDKIDQAWQSRSIPQDLVYRLGVRENGEIVGYKPVNPAAASYAKQTPLLDLLTIPAPEAAPATEPIAQYKVLFTASGGLEVAPWKEVMTEPVAGTGTEITEAAQLEEILPKLKEQINQNWQGTPTFSEDLVYRVRVKPDGTIISYQPENQVATDQVQETPFAKLGKPEADGNTGAAQEPFALFKVVFVAPDGRAEISPWRGWQ